jgi:hypothetical protein
VLDADLAVPEGTIRERNGQVGAINRVANDGPCPKRTSIRMTANQVQQPAIPMQGLEKPYKTPNDRRNP